jgi:hypothetical protein
MSEAVKTRNTEDAMEQTKRQLKLYIRTGSPIIYIVTKEERRILEVIRSVEVELNKEIVGQAGRNPPSGDDALIWEWIWTCSNGLRLFESPRKSAKGSPAFKTNCGVYANNPTIIAQRPELDGSFCRLMGYQEEYAYSATHALHQILHVHSLPQKREGSEWHANNVFIFLDLQEHIADRSSVSGLAERTVGRYLRDLDFQFRKRQSTGAGAMNTVIMISPEARIPEGLSRSVKLINVPLPTQRELTEELTRWGKANGVSLKFEGAAAPARKGARGVSQSTFVSGAKGLTRDEFVDFLNLRFLYERKPSSADGGRSLDVTEADYEKLLGEKKVYVEEGSGGALEYLILPVDMEAVGGLNTMKRWFRCRRDAFCESDQPGDRGYGLPQPKGMLIVGVPGGGKSLAAKAIASEWQVPCLRLDIGALRESLVGASERKLDNALKLCESIAPAILWIDEVEKGFVGKELGSDSGVSMRIYSKLLTWMQEKKARIFLVCTANDLKQLDTAFKRPGRFDNIMSVGLPGREACKDIIKIHYGKIWERYFDLKEIGTKGSGRQLTDPQMNELAGIAFEGKLSGAAIEKRLQDALYVYHGGLAEPSADTLDMERVFSQISSVLKNGYPKALEITAPQEWEIYEPADDEQVKPAESPAGKRQTDGQNLTF